MSTQQQGSQRIRSAFAAAKVRGGALLPFITGCYPHAGATERLLRELPAAGADLVEVGFAFSDPIADGPVIAESMHRALLGGATPARTFEAIARARCTVPVIAMVSASIVERMGAARFVSEGVAAGCAGFIVPDADPAESETLARLADAAGAGFCPLVAPTTSPERMAALQRIASGFVYLLARAGVTGERNDAPEIASRVAALRAGGCPGQAAAPVAAGFGISTREHVASVLRHADGAIVGSAIVRAMTAAREADSDPVEAALAQVRSLRD